MLRHPAEPYLPFVVALRAAIERDDNALPWLEATLERAKVYGPAHMLLARLMTGRDPALARVEYHIALEQAPELVDFVAAEAPRLVGSYFEATELLPGGTDPKVVAAFMDGLVQAVMERLPGTAVRLDADLAYTGAAAALEGAFPGRAFGLTDENFQSRCRGMLLMGATSEPAVHRILGTRRVAVLNTGNKSEAATGYFTLYGDGIGAFGILGDCLKARVFALARELGPAIPRGVLERRPTAELRPDQTDEASLIPYRQLDAILGTLLEARRQEETILGDLECLLEGPDLDQARAALPRIFDLLRRSEFKRRQLPFSLKVSPWAFGRGRRIPLTGLWMPPG